MEDLYMTEIFTKYLNFINLPNQLELENISLK